MKLVIDKFNTKMERIQRPPIEFIPGTYSSSYYAASNDSYALILPPREAINSEIFLTWS